MNPLFHTGFSISDSLKSVRKNVLIYETIIDYAATRKTLEDNINDLDQKLFSLRSKEDLYTFGRSYTEAERFNNTARQFLGEPYLTRLMATTFVSAIYLYEDHYEIQWSFKDILHQQEHDLGGIDYATS